MSGGAFGLDEKPGDLVKTALREIMPSVKNWKSSLLIFLFALLLAQGVAVSNSKTQELAEGVALLCDAQLALLGCTLAFYALVFGVLSQKMLVVMTEVESRSHGEIGYFSAYFKRVLVLQFLAFVSAFAVRLCMAGGVSDGLISLVYAYRYCMFVLLAIFEWYQLRVIWEFKSVIYNAGLVVGLSQAILYKQQDGNRQ